MQRVVEDNAFVCFVEFDERTCARLLVDDVPGMDGQHRRVGFGLGRESFDCESGVSFGGCGVANVLGEGFELRAL